MKIQNVEMEFVTFDAQDVIATSGPGGVLGYFAGSVVDQDDGSTFWEKLNGTFCLGPYRSHYNGWLISSSELSENNFYIINSASWDWYDDDKNFFADMTGTDTEPSGSGYHYLEDSAAILGWLLDIATQQQ